MLEPRGALADAPHGAALNRHPAGDLAGLSLPSGSEEESPERPVGGIGSLRASFAVGLFDRGGHRVAHERQRRLQLHRPEGLAQRREILPDFKVGPTHRRNHVGPNVVVHRLIQNLPLCFRVKG